VVGGLGGGAPTALRMKLGAPSKPAEQQKLDDTLAVARAHLSAAAYADAWGRGRVVPLEQLPLDGIA
jgi:hypothetical protein